MYKTYNCGELRKENIGEIITLSGWVHSIRNFGIVIFIDLRDHNGITQLYFKKKDILLGKEFVIKIFGEVIERLSKNFNNSTGDIEVLVFNIKVLNISYMPPFTIENSSNNNEELRMKYRYLDIRRNIIKNKLMFRHKMLITIRKYLSKSDFIEIETPILGKETSEGARCFLVTSRINTGCFFALSQSPQYFKQLLMLGGINKYFQIVKCFRDEDFRSDRQPEFTQIDCEMSFIKKKDILFFSEGLIKYIFKIIRGIQLNKFYNLSYKEALHFYGTDKPDLRFEMKFVKLNVFTKKKALLWQKELGIGITVSGIPDSQLSRKKLNKVLSRIQSSQIDTQVIIWVKCLKNGQFHSSRECDNNDFKSWGFRLKAKEGDFFIIIFGKTRETQGLLSECRLEIGKLLGLCQADKYAVLWVVDFPLLKKINKERYYPLHHPFTNPQEYLNKYPERMIGQSYDLIINGIEIGGGSIRINKSELQEQIFNLLGFSKEISYKEFGFLIKSFNYGAPPHGGIAFGLDRLIAVLFGDNKIRDFIAFPKNSLGKDLMIECTYSPNKIYENY